LSESSSLPEPTDMVHLIELSTFDREELSREPVTYQEAREKKANDPDRFEILPYGRTAQLLFELD
jgi:hypothetical protein